MIKHLSKISGVAAFAVIASSASAEVKINENLSLDGYAIGSSAVLEGTADQNDTFLDSGDKLLDAVKVALNGKYGDFSGKVSLLAVPNLNSSNGTSGLLDAYVTYTAGEFAITGGKFNSWLGYESFDSVNNPFLTYGAAGFGYFANYDTGAKVEYITKEISAGISVRDSLLADPDGGFFQGDGNFANDLGYEAYVLYSGIDKLTVFLGAGYQDVDNSETLETYNAWASYALTDKVTLVGEVSSTDFGAFGKISFAYTFLTTYKVNDSWSVSGRYGHFDSDSGDYSSYGVASTYYITQNFGIKGEVTKEDFNSGGDDTFFYAVQGIFKF